MRFIETLSKVPNTSLRSGIQVLIDVVQGVELVLRLLNLSEQLRLNVVIQTSQLTIRITADVRVLTLPGEQGKDEGCQLTDLLIRKNDCLVQFLIWLNLNVY